MLMCHAGVYEASYLGGRVTRFGHINIAKARNETYVARQIWSPWHVLETNSPQGQLGPQTTRRANFWTVDEAPRHSWSSEQRYRSVR
jgi:hypothetical protein